ncbi:Uncharacterised protein [Klebsiella michiganensis]|nr:Uncharacterised protein [Klebsiella michiganensis]
MTAAKTDYVKLEYQILDLVEYNGLKINGNMKILLSMIYSYERKKRTYYESITTLGKRVGLEPQAARNLVSKLCDAGMISYEERAGSSHIFHSKPLNQELMIFITDEKPKKPRGKKVRKSEEKEDDGKSEMQAATADQSVGMASESAASTVGQRDSVESDNDGSSDDRAAGNHAVKQEEPFPWQGDTFIKNRLSENAYQWAITAGATDWRHACRLVWEKIELTPPTEIDEHFKPLSLCEDK